jgi:hypothetical protein
VFGGAAAFATDPPGLAAQLLAAAGVADPVRRAAGRTLAARHTWDAAAAAHLRFYAGGAALSRTTSRVGIVSISDAVLPPS